MNSSKGVVAQIGIYIYMYSFRRGRVLVTDHLNDCAAAPTSAWEYLFNTKLGILAVQKLGMS